MRSILTAMGVALAVTYAAPAAAFSPADLITPAFTYVEAPGTPYSEPGQTLQPGTLGYSFTLSSSSTVNALGYWSDGFPLVFDFGTKQVGIWDSAGVLVSSAFVTAQNEIDGYYYSFLTVPVVLAAGNYVIGGGISDGEYFPEQMMGVVSAPGYTYNDSLEGVEIGFAQPMRSGLSQRVKGGGYGEQGIALVNFSFSQISAVPEPATWALMILGFGVVGTSLRRRRKVTVTLNFA